MFADDSFRFDLLGAQWALAQISSAKNRQEPTDWAEKDGQCYCRPDLILLLTDGKANDGIDATPENHNAKNELLVSHRSLRRHAACQKRAHFGPILTSTGVSS